MQTQKLTDAQAQVVEMLPFYEGATFIFEHITQNAEPLQRAGITRALKAFEAKGLIKPLPNRFSFDSRETLRRVYTTTNELREAYQAWLRNSYEIGGAS
jgi:Fe2+ or Zn2+ uptake regulation protein